MQPHVSGKRAADQPLLAVTARRLQACRPDDTAQYSRRQRPVAMPRRAVQRLALPQCTPAGRLVCSIPAARIPVRPIYVPIGSVCMS